MKKVLSMVVAVVLVFAMAACTSNDGGKNGEFSARRSDAYAQGDGHGWRDILTVKYENGKMVSATYDAEYAYGEDFPIGTLKSTLTVEQYPMKDPTVAEWMPALNAQILAAGTSDKIDGVAGATSASEGAKALLAAIEKEGKAGETVEVP